MTASQWSLPTPFATAFSVPFTNNVASKPSAVLLDIMTKSFSFCIPNSLMLIALPVVVSYDSGFQGKCDLPTRPGTSLAMYSIARASFLGGTRSPFCSARFRISFATASSVLLCASSYAVLSFGRNFMPRWIAVPGQMPLYPVVDGDAMTAGRSWRRWLVAAIDCADICGIPVVVFVEDFDHDLIDGCDEGCAVEVGRGGRHSGGESEVSDRP
jgi:hypothetical protein